RKIGGPELGEHVLDRLHLAIELLVRRGRVDDMEDHVGDERLLERRGEALDELVRQAADEADRVRHEVPPALVLACARRRVERLEGPVLDGALGPGKSVAGGRLPPVRVAGGRDLRRLAAAALLAAGRALALELREAPLEQRDPASCLAAVALELGLAGAARADAAAEPLEML